MDFNDIQPETMTAQVTKYAKMVYQFEKGLPPNGVVPALKHKVEDTKDKVWKYNEDIHDVCMVTVYVHK